MEDSSILDLQETKHRSSSGIKRNKVSRACDECRKRKVRCDGAQPCARCQKSSADCIFSNVTPKRGPPKQYIEPFENRLKLIEKILNTLDIININDLNKDKDTMDHSIHISIGAYCIPSHPTDTDPLRYDLIQAYFDHIHPFIPFIHQPTFIPHSSPLLLYSLYAVSSICLPHQQDPPGWDYYKTAMGWLDSYTEPCLSTLQSLLLLIKYNEQIQRPGFLWRTKYLLHLATQLSETLGLSRQVPANSGLSAIEIEVRRRTYWVITAYELLMCTEQGFEPYFHEKKCTVEYPHVLKEESELDTHAILQFHWLSKVIHMQAAVLQFIRSKYSEDSEDEADQFQALEVRLNELEYCLPLITEGSSLQIPFLHIAYHSTLILLLRPYATPHDHRFTRCLTSATMITQIIDRILAISNGHLEPFYYFIRGTQQMIYYLSTALTVLRQGQSVNRTDPYLLDKACSLLQLFTAKSPVTELETTLPSEDKTVSPSNTSSTRSSPLLPASKSPHSPNTLRKRSSRSSIQTDSMDMYPHRLRSASRSPYAINRLSAPALGISYQSLPIQCQPKSISSYSQPSSPTASFFQPGSAHYSTSSGSSVDFCPSSTFPGTPRRTSSLSSKKQLRRTASSITEYIVPSQRTRSGPYLNPRRHTLTNTTPPDLSNLLVNQRHLHAMAIRNHRFSVPLFPSQAISQQSMMLDPSFPMDPVIPHSPSESMMGLLLDPQWQL
ncbi:fungal-specific transcription factor domain-containing protein [Pilobolus umbonatus]|nr:fungal-specific transcription factor domain-containing protein [Pilobolus umbonatus]